MTDPPPTARDEVYALLAHNPCAFLYFGVCRIGHNASEVRHILAAFVQPIHHLVIQSRAFQRSAAVCQQHVLAYTVHFFFDGALGAPLAKVLADGGY